MNFGVVRLPRDVGFRFRYHVAGERNRQRDAPFEEFHLDDRIMKKPHAAPSRVRCPTDAACGYRAADRRPPVGQRLVFPGHHRQRLGGEVHSTGLRRQRRDLRGYSPAWSPDGLRIAYLDDNLHLYDRAADTSVRLTDALPLGGPLSWSRGGAQIAMLGWFEGSSGWTRECS